MFYVPYLLCAQLIIEYHHTHQLRSLALFGVVQFLLPFVVGLFLRLDVFANLLQLSGTHVCHARRSVDPLRESLNGDGTRRVGKKFQFVKVFLRLRLVLLGSDKTHQYRRLRLSL